MLKRSLLLCCLLLVACQSNDSKVDQNLWKQIVEVNTAFNNYHTVMDSKQSMHSNGKTASANSAIDLYISEAPYQAREIVNIRLDDIQFPPTQFYINDNFVYMHLLPDFKWAMLQNKKYDDLKENIKRYEHHLQNQVELINKYKESFQMKESKHLYSFIIDHSSESFKALYSQIVYDALPDDFRALLHAIEVDSGKMTIEIDKQNFKLRKIISFAQYKATVNGLDAKIEQKVMNIYTNHDTTNLIINQNDIDKAEIL